MKNQKHRGFVTILILEAVLLGAGACGGGSSAPGPGDITTIAGTGERATQPSDGNGDGVTDAPIPQDRARFDTPMDAIIDPAGAVLILDWNGHKVRRLTSAGMVEFVVGTGVEGDACESPRSDGSCPLVASELNHMTDVTFDSAGRLVISAWHNAKIKMADLATDSLRDVCGSGTRRFTGDGGPCVDAAGTQLVSFDLPSSVVYDKQGNLLIADQANQVIRRLGSDGMLMTVVGNCPSTPGFGCPLGQGYAGDGGRRRRRSSGTISVKGPIRRGRSRSTPPAISTSPTLVTMSYARSFLARTVSWAAATRHRRSSAPLPAPAPPATRATVVWRRRRRCESPTTWPSAPTAASISPTRETTASAASAPTGTLRR